MYITICQTMKPKNPLKKMMKMVMKIRQREKIGWKWSLQEIGKNIIFLAFQQHLYIIQMSHYSNIYQIIENHASNKVTTRSRKYSIHYFFVQVQDKLYLFWEDFVYFSIFWVHYLFSICLIIIIELINLIKGPLCKYLNYDSNWRVLFLRR